MDSQMDITNSFSDRITTKTFGGVKTFCSWNSIEQEHFKKMFSLRDDEFVTRIEVDDHGITATIEKR